MKRFNCQACGQVLAFEDQACSKCASPLGYLPDRETLSALSPAGEGLWQAIAEPDGPARRKCFNAETHAVCNWLVTGESESSTLCIACGLNRTIPDLSIAGNHSLWRKVEDAKHRLVYGLLRLGLPVTSKVEHPEAGLAFDFLADPLAPFQDSPTIMTGHAQGIVTLNIAEADDAVREARRRDMDEPYRTLLGHFRHESGHYYWERLIRRGGRLRSFRSRFGDERADYTQALARHHEQGPPADWPERFISAYASCHPWEDWAETWAHYLHIVDALETARENGIRIDPPKGSGARPSRPRFDPYHVVPFDTLIRHWMPLADAVNRLNRSLGQPDIYPFAPSPEALLKLRFVHRLVKKGAGSVSVRLR
jgi:hypothetical protein